VWAQLSIVYEGAYSCSPRHPQLDGYELYEKNGSQYKLIHTSEAEFKAEVTVDIGESKTYVARVYTYNKSGKKIYSNYSNEIKIENVSPATPTLSTPAGALEPDGVWAQLSIVYEGAYSCSPRHPQLDGYELYEKNGSQYKLIHTSETEFKAEVTVDIGESKTYVARVYTYNKSNQKIYSNYSNEIVIK